MFQDNPFLYGRDVRGAFGYDDIAVSYTHLGYELLSNLQLVTIQKEEIPRISSFCIISEKLFLSVFHVVLVTVHELVNTSCRVNQFNLTGIERV